MEPLIDTHLHLVYPDRFSYPWMEGAPALKKPFTLEDYESLTRGASIEAALFMEVDVAGEQSAEEATFFSNRVEKGNSCLKGVIASARPEHDGFEDYLDSIHSPHLKAIRRVLHVVDDAVSQSTRFRENIAKLASRNLPFDICMLPRQHEFAGQLVDACPEVTFILDHCGNPNLSAPEEFAAWSDSLRKLARRPNLYAKLSGIVATAPRDSVNEDTVFPYLNETLDAFGPTRLIWGSDWPVCTLTTELPDWIRLFRQWLSSLSADEEAQIAHLNARRIYAIG